MVTNKRTEVGECPFSQEIIVEILSRLPVKFLIRFKSVSKEWLKLISSSGSGSVKQKHDMRMDQSPYLVAWNDSSLDESNKRHCCWYPNEVTIRFSVINPFEENLQNRFELQLPGARSTSLQVCHGLCLMDFKYNYVFNPSTQEILKLPDLLKKRQASRTRFGYLANKNEYKIVSWFYKSETPGSYSFKIGCQILTLTDGGRANTRTWRVGPEQPTVPSDPCLSLNGVLYWLDNWCGVNLEKPKWLKKTSDWVLFSFDLEKEEYQFRPCAEFPPNPKRQSRDIDLLEFEGCLCVGIFFHQESTTKLWKFKNDVWEMKYDIKFPSYITGLWTSPVAYISESGDDDELIFIIKRVSDGILYYNTRSKTFRRPQILPQFVSRGVSYKEQPFLYYDTLFCLGAE